MGGNCKIYWSVMEDGIIRSIGYDRGEVRYDTCPGGPGTGYDIEAVVNLRN